jgi:hypothetical protein
LYEVFCTDLRPETLWDAFESQLLGAAEYQDSQGFVRLNPKNLPRAGGNRPQEVGMGADDQGRIGEQKGVKLLHGFPCSSTLPKLAIVLAALVTSAHTPEK